MASFQNLQNLQSLIGGFLSVYPVLHESSVEEILKHRSFQQFTYVLLAVFGIILILINTKQIQIINKNWGLITSLGASLFGLYIALATWDIEGLWKEYFYTHPELIFSFEQINNCCGLTKVTDHAVPPRCLDYIKNAVPCFHAFEQKFKSEELWIGGVWILSDQAVLSYFTLRVREPFQQGYLPISQSENVYQNPVIFPPGFPTQVLPEGNYPQYIASVPYYPVVTPTRTMASPQVISPPKESNDKKDKNKESNRGTKGEGSDPKQHSEQP